jgi:4-hydroxybenzoate polyprenyltransferase
VSASAPSAPRAVLDRLRQYAALTRLDRPVGAVLLLWPTWWALWLAARGWPGWHLFAVFTAGVVLMRSAGCAINDYFDRGFDAQVTRTRMRPLARGALAPAEALGVFAVLSLAAYALAQTLDPVVVSLAWPALALAACYPLAKRYTHLPQLVLGLAFSWGIPMAFAARTGEVPALGWLLLLGNAFWVVAYDTLYAMADRPDDLRAGVKSTAILFGSLDRPVIALLHASALATLALVGWNAHLHWPYYAGLAAAAGIAVHLHLMTRSRGTQDALRAFRASPRFGAAVFAGLAASFLAG